jgi:hypothetical protein
MMALVAMEQPISLSAEHIRREKVKVLQCVAPLELDDLVVGQVGGGGGGERCLRSSTPKQLCRSSKCISTSGGRAECDITVELFLSMSCLVLRHHDQLGPSVFVNKGRRAGREAGMPSRFQIAIADRVQTRDRPNFSPILLLHTMLPPIPPSPTPLPSPVHVLPRRVRLPGGALGQQQDLHH